jgi:hypothetical protein
VSDLTRSGELPPELTNLLAWVACIADARPVEEYMAYLEAAAFRTISVEHHHEALVQLVSDIRTKLLAAELLATLGTVKLPFTDFAQAKVLAKTAAEAVHNGLLGYALLTATRDI